MLRLSAAFRGKSTQRSADSVSPGRTNELHGRKKGAFALSFQAVVGRSFVVILNKDSHNSHSI